MRPAVVLLSALLFAACERRPLDLPPRIVDSTEIFQDRRARIYEALSHLGSWERPYRSAVQGSARGWPVQDDTASVSLVREERLLEASALLSTRTAMPLSDTLARHLLWQVPTGAGALYLLRGVGYGTNTSVSVAVSPSGRSVIVHMPYLSYYDLPRLRLPVGVRLPRLPDTVYTAPSLAE